MLVVALTVVVGMDFDMKSREVSVSSGAMRAILQKYFNTLFLLDTTTSMLLCTTREEIIGLRTPKVGSLYLRSVFKAYRK